MCCIAGIEMKFKHMLYPVMIAPTLIPELNAITHTKEGIHFGASVTLTQLDQTLKAAIDTLPGSCRTNYSKDKVVYYLSQNNLSFDQ